MSVIKPALEPWMVEWLREGDWDDLPNEILTLVADDWVESPEEVTKLANELIAKAIEALL